MSRQSNRRWLVLVLVVIGAASILAWRILVPPRVEVQVPTRGAAVRAVYATGIVEPTVMLPIAPRVAGRLLELRVDEGARVVRDQVLARLEDTDLERTVEELEAHARFAETDYQRAQALVARGLGPKAERDRAHAEWQAAEAAAARARAQREFMWLKAPSDGTILRRDGEVGELIATNQPLFHISCCEELRVTADVDEEDIPLVKPGQRVLIGADAFPGQVFEGRVTDITPMGDPTTRTYRVRIGLVGRTPLRIGMTNDVNIIVERREQAMLIPATAVNGDRVWVVEDGRLARTPVTTGIAGGVEVEVLSGLAADAQVVVMPDPDLAAGMRVRTRPVQPRGDPQE